MTYEQFGGTFLWSVGEEGSLSVVGFASEGARPLT